MKNRESIFREKFINNRNNKWKGQALITPNIPLFVIIFFSSIIFLLIVTLIFFANYTRRIIVIGEVVTSPQPVTLFSTKTGIISELYVKPADIVKKGDKLYKIDFSKITDSGNVNISSHNLVRDQKEIVDSIIAKLLKNKEETINNLKLQLEQYVQSKLVTDSLLNEAKDGMDLLKKNAASYHGYYKRRLITKEQFVYQNNLLYQQQSVFQNLLTQKIQLDLAVEKLKTELITAPIDFDNQIDEYRYQQAELTIKLANLELEHSMFITAPNDGKIESLSVTPGQMVNIGDSLAQLSLGINREYQLVFWLPNNSIPYIKVNDLINIRYDAFPYQKFGQFVGRIIAISSVSASKQELSSYNNSPLMLAPSPQESYYKVTASLADSSFKYQDKNLFIVNGMKAETTVFLETRPLYEWIFTPFYMIKKSLALPREIDEDA